MSKESASVPLYHLTSSNPQHEVKSSQRKKQCTNSLKFKLTFLVLICLLIVLLITALTIVLLRSHEKPCSGPISMTSQRPTFRPKIRVANRFWNEYYLPPSVTVTHYNLTLQLLNTTYDILKYNRTNKFYGLVNVYFRINSQTSFVVLHAKHLKVHSIAVKEASKSNERPVNVNITEIIYDDVYDYMILVLNRPLNNGLNYVVEAKYSGVMNNDDSGIITTTYYDVSKRKKFYLLYSKLEPIGARQLCPCFDEPDKKATYTMKIIHEERYEALSNMPLRGKQGINFSQLLFSENHWNQTRPLTISEFKKTEIPMSIYLLAFVLIENYQYVAMNRDRDKLVRVWFPTDLNNSAPMSLSYSSNTETFFEKYFNYSSPLPKTDHVYIPDFLSGAMENWGLVTYRDRHLLVSEDQSQYQYRTSLLTIAHELAHFWFGNWITTKTWGEIWLNEGFATYFASYAYYSRIPENEAQELFLYERRNILIKDTNAHVTVIVNVTEPALFKSVFTTLTYHKGQALLVWMNSIMGESRFHKAIKTYIERYATKNPTNEEFFDCMDEVGPLRSDLTNIPKFKTYFRPYLYKPGFPIVTVNYDIGKEEIILTQKSNLVNSSSSEKWPIHTTYKTTYTLEDTPIYFNGTKTFKRSLGENGFILINSNGKSYLRVNYSELLWHRIINELKSPNSKISQTNKIVLLDDAFYFLGNNSLNASIAKGLIETYLNETNAIPWMLFYYKFFDRVNEYFKNDILFERFSELITNLSSKILAKTLKIDTSGDVNIIDDINQRVILTINCEVGNDEALNWVSNKFLEWIKDPSVFRLPKHLTRIILYYGIRINDKERYWTKLWNMLIKSSVNGPISRDTLALGLAGTAKPYLLIKLLDRYLEPDTHRNIHDKQQDFLAVVEWIMKSPNGFLVLQRWIVAKSERIMRYAFGDISKRDQSITFISLLTKICKYIYEPHLIKPILNLTKRYHALEKTVLINNNWRETIGKKLIQLL